MEVKTYEVGITTTYYDVYEVEALDERTAIEIARRIPCPISIHSDGEAFILSTNGEKNWGLT